MTKSGNLENTILEKLRVEKHKESHSYGKTNHFRFPSKSGMFVTKSGNLEKHDFGKILC